MSWRIERWREAPGAFHAREVPADPARAAWVCDPTHPALVLGSAQRDDIVDRAAADAAGVEVVRRRSGGGAVLVVPGDLVWVDLVVPAGDPLWDADVGRAFQWVGGAWAAALGDLGIGARVHAGALEHSRWSRLVCFAGRGPGEVSLPAGPKVVGISQRRTRQAARFQCAALRRWDPGALLGLFRLDEPQRREATAQLADAAAGLDVDGDALVDALLRRLPA